MAKTYDARERDRIRAALLGYMQENKAGTPKLESLTGVPYRTLQRFLKGAWVNEVAVARCAAFLDRQPRRPILLHALGDYLYRFYNHPPDFIGGVYRVSTADTPLSELTIKFPPDSKTFYLASERTTGRLLRAYDGILVFTGRSLLAILKDRLMRLRPRSHAPFQPREQEILRSGLRRRAIGKGRGSVPVTADDARKDRPC